MLLRARAKRVLSLVHEEVQQVLVTYTALLIQFNTFEKDLPRFEAEQQMGIPIHLSDGVGCSV